MVFKIEELAVNGYFFKKTIFNFLDNFCDDVHESIFKATSFLITKADGSSDTKSIIELVTRMKQNGGNLSLRQSEIYKALIEEVVKENRVFCMDFYDNNVDAGILQKIY